MTTSTVTVFTAEEVAVMLRCNVETIHRWARRGTLKSCRQPGQRAYRFTQEQIDEFLSGPKVETNKPKTPLPSRNPRYAK